LRVKAVQWTMIYHFANCSIDAERHAFLWDEKSVHVEPQVFELLRALVRKQGRLVTKDDLVETVWHGLSVSDATISARINAARKAVGDNGKDQAIIKTVGWKSSFGHAYRAGGRLPLCCCARLVMGHPCLTKRSH
jgi:DNA-binding winged helix-turn-helix (wHTH) protein